MSGLLGSEVASEWACPRFPLKSEFTAPKKASKVVLLTSLLIVKADASDVILLTQARVKDKPLNAPPSNGTKMVRTQ